MWFFKWKAPKLLRECFISNIAPPERVQNRGSSCVMRADSRYFWTLRSEPPQVVVQSSPPHDSTRICQNELDLARFLQGSRARIKYNLQLPTPWFKAMALGKHVLSGLGCSRCGSLNGKLPSFWVSVLFRTELHRYIQNGLFAAREPFHIAYSSIK